MLALTAVVVVVGRAMRAQLNDSGRRPSDAKRHRAPARDWAVTPLPTGVARTLTERGLVNAEQLAGMSPAEREFFVATVAARVGEGPKPRLVPPSVHGASATAANPVGLPAEARSPIAPSVPAPADPTTPGSTTPAAPALAALVSGQIHCPVCRAPLGQRQETPLLMARCPGCSRRIAARVDGNRLIVTLDYGG